MLNAFFHDALLFHHVSCANVCKKTISLSLLSVACYSSVEQVFFGRFQTIEVYVTVDIVVVSLLLSIVKGIKSMTNIFLGRFTLKSSSCTKPTSANILIPTE